MHKEGVFEYIIDNINNLLEQGIDYYKDDSVNRAKLIRYYEYINEVEEDVNLPESNNNINFNYDIIDRNTIEIKKLSDSFMNKLTSLKISVLNLENDLSLYCKEDSKDESDIDLEATGVIKPIKIESVVNEESSDDDSTSIFDIFKKRNR